MRFNVISVVNFGR